MSQQVATIIANQIIEMITSGKLTSWKKGWSCNDTGLKPFNVDSNRPYTGVFNIISLNIAANGRIPAFAPASKMRIPSKGSKSIKILQPIIVQKENNGEKETKFLGCKYLNVFHYSDFAGIDHKAIEEKFAPKEGETKTFKSIEACENMVNNMPNLPSISHGGDRAFYRPSTDSIGMPKKESFHSENEYYSTLFHELAHSTMHFTRLDRKQSRDGLENGHHEYSFEELVAELSACVLCDDCQILTNDLKENAGAYMASWIKPLQSNPEWIIKASSEANKVHKYIANLN